MAFDGKAHACHGRHLAGAPRDNHRHFLCVDGTAAGLHAAHHTLRDVNAGHLTILNQIHTKPIRPPRIAPSNSIMPRRTRPPLQQAAINRETPLIIVEVRHHLAQLRDGQ